MISKKNLVHILIFEISAAYEGVVNLGQTSSTPASNSAPTVNHLLQGKNAILSMKGKRPGPPPGSIPPSLRSRSKKRVTREIIGETGAAK